MKVPSTEIQNNFGKYLKFAEVGEEIIVTRNGRNIVKLVPYQESGVIREDAAEYRIKGDRVSYEEFLELVEHSEQRFELIDGVVYNLAAPTFKHQSAIREIQGAFFIWFKGKRCTPLTSPLDITFVKSEDNICVVQPDIVVVCDPDNLNDKGNYQGTPTLAVEVLSPSTRNKDMTKKLSLYRDCGVQEYWVVNPMNRYVHVYLLRDNEIENERMFSGQDLVESFYFERLQLPVSDIFA
jgi:prevent-host-death family protein